MRTTLAICLMFALIPPALAKKPHVVIRKPVAPVVRPVPFTPVTLAFVAAPPLLVFYDLERRTSCAGAVDTLGLGGPGFDGRPVGPGQGNVMTPCWQRRLGQAMPK